MEGYSSVSRRAKVTVVRENNFGCLGWVHNLCTWAPGMAEPISQGGCSDATAMHWASRVHGRRPQDLDVHGHGMHFRVGQVQAVCEVLVCVAVSCLSGQKPKTRSARLARLVCCWVIDHPICLLLKINMAVGKTDSSSVESSVEAARERKRGWG